MVIKAAWSLAIVACSLFLAQFPLKEMPKTIASEKLQAQLSNEQLSETARAITVKVLSGNTWGSGIIIASQEQGYWILTNRHVLTPADTHQIKTPDGRLYNTSVLKNANFQGKDLALLQFRSKTVYRCAALGNASGLAIGDEVWAAGFPVDGTGLVITRGQIKLLLPQALQEGYQIGYTNDIGQGMSGGPLLNRQGQVIGINGRHAYPLWGDPYMFQDGSLPSEFLKQQMIPLSWAISSQNFRQLSR